MHEVILPLTCMFEHELDLLQQEATYTKKMWLKQVRCPINDWLREHVQGEYEVWKWWHPEPPTFPEGYMPTDEELYRDPMIQFKFADPSDAMRFKLTWG